MIGLVAPYSGRVYIPGNFFRDKKDFLQSNSVKSFKRTYIFRHKQKAIRSAYDEAKFSFFERMATKIFVIYAWFFEKFLVREEMSVIREFLCFLGFGLGMLTISLFEKLFNYRIDKPQLWATLSYNSYTQRFPECVPHSLRGLIDELNRKASEQKVEVEFEVEYISNDPLLWVKYGYPGQGKNRRCIAIWNENSVILA